MSKPDWKDLLQSKTEQLPINEHVESNPTPSAEASSAKQDLVIRFEKRNGKPATIVSRFEGSESALKELAAALKKHCGTGGSAKDDEILIQGDVRTKVAAFLRKQGHRVKGDLH